MGVETNGANILNIIIMTVIGKKGNIFVNANTGNPLTLSIDKKKEMEQVFNFSKLYLELNEVYVKTLQVNEIDEAVLDSMAKELGFTMHNGIADSKHYSVIVTPTCIPGGFTPITIFYNK